MSQHLPIIQVLAVVFSRNRTKADQAQGWIGEVTGHPQTRACVWSGWPGAQGTAAQPGARDGTDVGSGAGSWRAARGAEREPQGVCKHRGGCAPRRLQSQGPQEPRQPLQSTWAGTGAFGALLPPANTSGRGPTGWPALSSFGNPQHAQPLRLKPAWCFPGLKSQS